MKDQDRAEVFIEYAHYRVDTIIADQGFRFLTIFLQLKLPLPVDLIERGVTIDPVVFTIYISDFEGDVFGRK